MISIPQLEERLQSSVGDPAIRVIALPRNPPVRQIVCREQDEDVIERIVRRYVDSEVTFEFMGL